jgi:hypothetical protein
MESGGLKEEKKQSKSEERNPKSETQIRRATDSASGFDLRIPFRFRLSDFGFNHLLLARPGKGVRQPNRERRAFASLGPRFNWLGVVVVASGFLRLVLTWIWVNGGDPLSLGIRAVPLMLRG